MRKFLHMLYFVAGWLFCNFCLLWWKLRDKITPPETDSVLFVAHPDDDTLFFHSFIKEKKPYVCLMTTGYSLRRLPCFFKTMKHYGIKYRAYSLKSRDKRTDLLEKHVKDVLKIKNFDVIVTHNENGEYGHEEHIRVHDAVMNVCKNNKDAQIFCPVDVSKIRNYPLEDKIIEEKSWIFNNIYTTEAWVLDEEEAGTPIWVINEKLIEKRENL